MPSSKRLDAVFEGGGIKGVGLAGALEATEDLGYEFVNLVGTSAGAIVAALVAADYTASELRKILFEQDFTLFQDCRFPCSIPILGSVLGLGIHKGLYEGRYFEEWLQELLARKKVHTFKDLIIKNSIHEPRFRYRLQVVASDISNGRMIVLPGDLAQYGLDPDRLSVAQAVRMSMSIPFFYRPSLIRMKRKRPSYIVDGGILSNYPLWVLTEANNPNPPWPTIGYKLVEPEEGRPNSIGGPISLFGAMFKTMMEAHDSRYISNHDFARTIPIRTRGVGTLEFDLSLERKEKLYRAGYQAARNFFETWDFEEYKHRYRQTPREPSRSTLLRSKAA